MTSLELQRVAIATTQQSVSLTPSSSASSSAASAASQCRNTQTASLGHTCRSVYMYIMSQHNDMDIRLFVHQVDHGRIIYNIMRFTQWWKAQGSVMEVHHTVFAVSLKIISNTGPSHNPFSYFHDRPGLGPDSSLRTPNMEHISSEDYTSSGALNRPRTLIGTCIHPRVVRGSHFRDPIRPDPRLKPISMTRPDPTRPND